MRFTTDKNGNQVIDHNFYESIGLYLSEDGYIEGMNENLYARYLLQQFDLTVRNDYQFYQYKDNYWQRISDRQLKKQLYKHFNHLVDDQWTVQFELQSLSALTRICKDSDELIPGDDYINLKNGLFHLGDNWEFLPHNKDVFTPIQIPATYDKDNEPDCPVFKSFLNDIYNGDQERVDLTQEIMGYCLDNSTKAHKFFIFYGHGRNGKSVLANIITALAGKENVTNIPLKSFNASFELADIVDKKVNISTENECMSLKTEKLKMISAGDSILINPKNEKPFAYTPCAKLIFAVNRLPNTVDTSEGFMERLCIIPFTNKYTYEPKNPGEKMIDPDLTDKLLKELDGIFVFALKGLQRLMQNNYRFSQSKQANDILQQYKATVNPMIDYINTELNQGTTCKVEKTSVYNHFKAWAESQGYKLFANISARAFYSDFEYTLQSLGVSFTPARIKGIRWYKGFKLVHPTPLK